MSLSLLASPLLLSMDAGAPAEPCADFHLRVADLMKYYVNSAPFDVYTRTVASDVDVYSLLWLARVKFDD